MIVVHDVDVAGRAGVYTAWLAANGTMIDAVAEEDDGTCRVVACGSQEWRQVEVASSRFARRPHF